jgi:hypothetical protein
MPPCGRTPLDGHRTGSGERVERWEGKSCEGAALSCRRGGGRELRAADRQGKEEGGREMGGAGVGNETVRLLDFLCVGIFSPRLFVSWW